MPGFDEIFYVVLPWIPFALPFAMLWLMVTLLQRGGLWMGQTYVDRWEQPRVFWTVIAFLAVATVFILVMLIFPDAVYAGLQSIGILPPLPSP